MCKRLAFRDFEAECFALCVPFLPQRYHLPLLYPGCCNEIRVQIVPNVVVSWFSGATAVFFVAAQG